MINSKDDFKLYGSCNSECLQAAAGKGQDFDLKLFAASSHGHMFLKKQKLTKIRNGQEVEVILNEPMMDRYYQGKDYNLLQTITD